MTDDLSPVERVALDIDIRLRDVWAEAVEVVDEEALEAVAAIMRISYATGYADGVEEGRATEGRPPLVADNGYRSLR